MERERDLCVNRTCDMDRWGSQTHFRYGIAHCWANGLHFCIVSDCEQILLLTSWVPGTINELNIAKIENGENTISISIIQFYGDLFFSTWRIRKVHENTPRRSSLIRLHIIMTNEWNLKRHYKYYKCINNRGTNEPKAFHWFYACDNAKKSHREKTASSAAFNFL